MHNCKTARLSPDHTFTRVELGVWSGDPTTSTHHWHSPYSEQQTGASYYSYRHKTLEYNYAFCFLLSCSDYVNLISDDDDAEHTYSPSPPPMSPITQPDRRYTTLNANDGWLSKSLYIMHTRSVNFEIRP